MRLLLPLFLIMAYALPSLAADSTPQDAPPAPSPQWTQAVGKIRKLHDTTRIQARQTVRSIAEERKALGMELRQLKAEKRKREAHYKALTDRFSSLIQQKRTLDKELDEQKASMRLIEGTVRTSAKQLRKRALNSPITAEYPDRLPTLEQLLDSDRFPGLDSIKSLADIWFAELGASGTIRSYDTTCVAPDGASRPGNVTRLGSLGALFLDREGRAAFLRPSASGKLEMVSGDFDHAVKKAGKFLAGKRGDAPLDFSGGEVFKRFNDEPGFLASLMNGGFLVWPILVVGLIGFLLSAERFWNLSRIHTCPNCQMGKAMEWAGKGDLKQCASCLGNKGNTPTCRVLSHVILHSGGTLVSMEKGLQEAILQELPKLERFLPTINILAAVAPLLGLLGTVTGMIGTFQVITIFGTGDARMMSGGISEALITTQLGLAVAVPLTLTHHFLERKVDRMVADMEEKGTTLVARLVASGKGE